MYFGYVFDSTRDRLILFGGHPQFLNDLWEFSLTTGKWNPIAAAGTPPAPRFGQTAIYDPARDQVVVYGGMTGVEQNDTWVLSLSPTPTWSQAATGGVTPARRRNHTAVYDAVNDQMVVYGGYDGTEFRNDVQALALSTMTWSDLNPTGPTPAARDLMTAVYDPNGRRIVLFGGWSGTDYLNDVWMLDLTGRPRWSRIQRLKTPHSTSPGVRRDYAAAYDPVGQRLLLFGGTDGTYLGEVWSLTLGMAEMWEPIPTSGSKPTGRYGAGAIFDPVRNEFVIVGGYDSNYRADVNRLSLNTGTWTNIPEPTTANPTERRDYAGALDAVNDRILYFGGETALGDVNDTYALSLGPSPTWTRVDNGAGSAPTPRHGAFGFMDAPTGDFFVFGGVDLFAYHNDLWRWNSSTGWVQVPVASAGPPPSGRMYTSVVYDAARDRYVVFGGHPSFLNDVWLLSLRPTPAWTALAPAGTPPAPRYHHAAVMDAAHDRMIVFGGIGQFGEVGDTWALNFSGAPAWQLLQNAGAPPGPRRIMGWDVDTARNRMVLFGGYDGSAFVNSTYAFSFDTNVWSQLTPAGTHPDPRDLMQIYYDASRDNFVLFGGFNVPHGFFDDIWTLGGFSAPQAFQAQREAVTALGLRAENPIRGSDLHFSLSLPTGGDAEIEVIDIGGRRIAKRSYPGLPAGVHRVDLGGTHLSPGVYFARLARGGEVATVRFAVVR